MTNQLAYTILNLVPENKTTENAFKSHHNKNRVALVDPGGRKPACYSIRLGFHVPPGNKAKGFVFGTAGDSDIRLKSDDLYGFHFCIKFNPTSGLLLVENRSALKLVAGKREMRKQGDSCVIQQNMRIRCGNFSFVASTPDRGQHQKKYAEILGKYLRTIVSDGIRTNPHASPVKPQRAVGQYMEIKNITNYTTTKTCLLADDKSGALYAAKKYRTPSNPQAVLDEIKILGNTHHKNIVHFVDSIFDIDSSIYVVTEYLSYGPLDKYEFMQTEGLEVLHQCLDGLAYLHRHNIMHRNIRPQTILVQSLKPLQVKISGFDLAKKGSKGASQVGQTIYLAPEMWNNSTYTNAVDVWALGITALTLFDAAPRHDPSFMRGATRSNRQRFLSIVRAAYRKKRLNRAVIKLLDVMLDADADTRISSRRCLELTKEAQVAMKKPAAPASPHVPKPGVFHVRPAKINVQFPKGRVFIA